MKAILLSITLLIALGASEVGRAQDGGCVPAGVGDRALKCTDGRGHYWYANINGVPSGTQQQKPMVYGDPAGAALDGRRAAMQDAAKLQQLQQLQEQQGQQQTEQAIDEQQFNEPRFQTDGAQCGRAGVSLYSDQPSQRAYYDLCMAQHGWHKPGSVR